MKIDSTPKTDPSSKAVTVPAQGSATAGRGSRAAGTGAVTGKDQITLSSTAAQLIEIADAGKAADEAHQAHVQRLATLVGSGRYQVNPRATADAMLRDHLLASTGTTTE